MTRQDGKRARPSSLWLLLVPVTCCGGPLLVTGLAAAGTAAWGRLGAALAVAAAGAMLVIRQRRRVRAPARYDRAAGLAVDGFAGDSGSGPDRPGAVAQPQGAMVRHWMERR